MGVWPVARLRLQKLTETVLSHNAIRQERARQEILGYFRDLSASFVKLQWLGEEIRNYISLNAWDLKANQFSYTLLSQGRWNDRLANIGVYEN